MDTGHCEGCDSPECARADLLREPHLRVQLSLPGEAWSLLRFCDLRCLRIWLDHELNRGPGPRAGEKVVA